MRITRAMCWSLLFCLILALGGCGASGKDDNKPVVKVKTNIGKQTVASLITRTKSIKGYSYHYTININGDNKTGQVWASGSQRRAETTIDGQKVVAIYDRRQQMVDIYYPQQKQVVKMVADDTPDLVASPEDYLQGILNDRINLLGETKYHNTQCRLILAQDPQSQAHLKLWVRTDLGIPVRVESTDPDGNSCVVEYTDIQVTPQPPSRFRIPPNTKVVDLVKMMGGNQNP